MIVNGNELDTNKFRARSGVIPFTIRDQKLQFLLGIDRRTRDLTDFGGGIKSGETVVRAAYREFTEESCNVFKGVVTIDSIKNSIAVTNPAQSVAIFFVHIPEMYIDCAESQFKESQEKLAHVKKHYELIGVKWINSKDFMNIAFNSTSQCMWRRIQNILKNNTNWFDLRINLILGPELSVMIKNYIAGCSTEISAVRPPGLNRSH